MFVNVAEGVSGSSTAYADVYLWRRACVVVMQHVKQGTGKPEKKAPAISTRTAENINARYEYVMCTDTQCIFPPPSPELQSWLLVVSRLHSTLNCGGGGFKDVDVRFLVLIERGLVCRVYRSRFCIFEGILSSAHHQWPLTCSSLSSAHMCVMQLRCDVYVALPSRKAVLAIKSRAKAIYDANGGNIKLD